MMPQPSYNPWGTPIFPDNAAFGTGSPAENAQRQPNLLDNLLSRVAGALGRGFMAPGQALQSTEPITTEQMIKPAADLAGMTTLGAGAIPADLNALRMGIKGYHRSPNDFEKFDLSHTGTTTDPGKLGTAHYFSTDANVASAGPHRYEASVDLKNPIELQYPNWGADKQALITEHLGLPLDTHAQDIRLAALKRGHDGVVLDYSPVGYNHKEIAAYHDDLVDILRKYGIAGMTAPPIFAGAMSEQKQ